MSFRSKAAILAMGALAALQRAFDYRPAKDMGGRWSGLPDPTPSRRLPRIRRRRQPGTRKYPANGHNP